ncbi:MAG: hypothetical protein WDN75_14455 [Bacteroidota bacterium]
MASSLLFLAVTAVIAATGIMVFGAMEPEFVASYVREFTLQIEHLSEEAVKQLGKDAIDRNLKALPDTNVGDLADCMHGKAS